MKKRRVICLLDLFAVFLFLGIRGFGAASAPEAAAGKETAAVTAAKTPGAKNTATAADSAKSAAPRNRLSDTPLARDFTREEKAGAATPEEEIEAVIRAVSLQPEWMTSPDGVAPTGSKNIWTRLREDYNLRGFIRFGIGTDEFWETRTGMAVDLVPDGTVRLGLEAGVGHYRGWYPWCDDWD